MASRGIKLDNKQRGQALVVVLLIMAVVLTIALSVVSRSVTDISVSKKEEDALRAISAAEAGAEKALIAGTGTSCTTGTCLPNAAFSATISGLAEGTKEYMLPTSLSSGDTATIWFVAHDTNKNITCNASNPCFTGDRLKICWGNPGTSSSASTTPAMEISVVSTTGSLATAKVGRVALDPNVARRNDNQFALADGSCTVDSRGTAFGKEFTLSSLGVAPRADASVFAGPLYARIRMIYNTDQTHPAGVSVNFGGNGVLPLQGTKVESLGESGEAKRKVVIYRPYSDLPSVFDFGLYSGGSDLSK